MNDKQKKAVYKRVFGREFDSKNRHQAPLPLDIAYQVALHALKNNKNESKK